MCHLTDWTVLTKGASRVVDDVIQVWPDNRATLRPNKVSGVLRPPSWSPVLFWGRTCVMQKLPPLGLCVKTNHVALCVAMQLEEEAFSMLLWRRSVVHSNGGDISGRQTALSRCGCLRSYIYYYHVLYHFTFFYSQNHSMSRHLLANDIFIFLQTFLNTFVSFWFVFSFSFFFFFFNTFFI